MSCLIGRQIKAGLSGNRRQHAATVAENIKMHLAGGEMKEVWRCLKGWYCAASEQAPTASPMSLAAQIAERVALYGKVPSLREPLPIHVNKIGIPDGVPSDQELRKVMRGLQNGRVAGAIGLRAEYIKVWLSDVVRKEEEAGPMREDGPLREGGSDKGMGKKWCIFVKLMKAVWEQGSVPKQMKWEIIALLPKGGGDYCGIGLLKPF